MIIKVYRLAYLFVYVAFFAPKYRPKSQIRLIQEYINCSVCNTKFFRGIAPLSLFHYRLKHDHVSYCFCMQFTLLSVLLIILVITYPRNSRYIALYAPHHGTITCVHECVWTVYTAAAHCLLDVAFTLMCAHYLRTVTAVMTLMVFKFLLYDLQ